MFGRASGGAAVVLLLGVRAVVLISVIVDVPDFHSAASERYRVIAETSGRPYRDFDVEYAPGELAIAEAVGSGTSAAARGLLAVIAFSGDVVAFAAIRRGWGADAARRYLWLGLPLLIFIYRRADLATAALTVTALMLARRHREGAGGLAMAAAFLTRLWPVILAPIWAIERNLRALWVFAVAASSGVIAWVAYGGLDGVGQVSSFRGATGWELESSVGVVVWALTDEHRFEAGANRTGIVPAWAGPVMLASLVAIFAIIWLRARGSRSEPAGPPALAAVAALLVVSPLLSPQYASWLLPWAAIAGVGGRRFTIAASVPIALTGAVVTGWSLDLGLGAGPDQAILFLRNCSLVAIVVTYFVWTRPDRPEVPARHGSAAPTPQPAR